MKYILLFILFTALCTSSCTTKSKKTASNTTNEPSYNYRIKQPDSLRIKKILDMKWGMFLHWSLGTVSGKEWTRGITTPDYFDVTGVNTDQWCEVAKEAGMGYIIFVAKHHDGFCLWNTQTTSFKVTNSPLKTDVLRGLRKSCDKYGIELCLYFSEADWTWPGYKNPEMKKAQLTELFTQYGEIPLIWLDVAQWDGGLGHNETVELIREYQPNCFIGFNHGLPAGDLQSREMGTFQKLEHQNAQQFLMQNEIDSLVALNEKYIMDLNWSEANKTGTILKNNYNGYKVAECAVCINQTNDKWYWFYNEETKDNAISAGQIIEMYSEAISSKVLFSLALGPNKNGELREVDILRLKEVGKLTLKNKLYEEEQ